MSKGIREALSHEARCKSLVKVSDYTESKASQTSLPKLLLDSKVWPRGCEMMHRRRPIHGTSRWGCPVGRYMNHLKLWRKARAGDKGLGTSRESVLSAKSSELRAAPCGGALEELGRGRGAHQRAGKARETQEKPEKYGFIGAKRVASDKEIGFNVFNTSHAIRNPTRLGN